jgi:hypothetical protein
MRALQRIPAVERTGETLESPLPLNVTGIDCLLVCSVQIIYEDISWMYLAYACSTRVKARSAGVQTY